MPLELFKRLLGAPSGEPLHPDDARRAIAALLVMAARADNHYADSERSLIDRLLMERYGLSAEAARALRAEGEAAEEEAVDHYQFTRAIRDAIPLEERLSIIEALWKVVLEDAGRDAMEDTLMRQLTERLGLSPRESAEARQRVQDA
ncbi:MAG: TerB family tellurite resistance protein [Hyphomonadaceae bacterium]